MTPRPKIPWIAKMPTAKEIQAAEDRHFIEWCRKVHPSILLDLKRAYERAMDIEEKRISARNKWNRMGENE